MSAFTILSPLCDSTACVDLLTDIQHEFYSPETTLRGKLTFTVYIHLRSPSLSFFFLSHSIVFTDNVPKAVQAQKSEQKSPQIQRARIMEAIKLFKAFGSGSIYQR